MPTTAMDVAKRAGVSIATVSYVYSGRRFVSPELIVRVRKAMEELDYHPSAPAQSLSSRRTQAIGLLISDITNPYFPEVARGVLDEAAAANYNTWFAIRTRSWTDCGTTSTRYALNASTV